MSMYMNRWNRDDTVAMIIIARTHDSPPGARMFNIVVMKLIAPIRDEIPARCRLNIARSTEPPE